MESFKEVVFFSFGLLIAAFLIGLYAHFGRISSEMAAQRHDEIAATQRIALARRWAACDGKSISGGEVIALLRENTVRGGEIAVSIDKNAYGLPVTMNADNASGAEFSLALLTGITSSVTSGSYTATASNVPGTYTRYRISVTDTLDAVSGYTTSGTVKRNSPPGTPPFSAPVNGSVTYNNLQPGQCGVPFGGRRHSRTYADIRNLHRGQG